jgi:hypothetical protein
VADHKKFLVGIIPAVYVKSEFKNPMGFYMSLLGKKVTIIQRCIEQCALMGADVIYIVSDLTVQNIVKYKYSTYVFDPIEVFEHYSSWATFKAHLKSSRDFQEIWQQKRERFKVIPVVFHPISLPVEMYSPSKSQVASLFLSAYEIDGFYSSMSSVNVQYYASFPQGVFPFSFLTNSKDGWDTIYKIRKLAKSHRFKFVHDGVGVEQQKWLGFSFESKDIMKFRKSFWGGVEDDKQAGKLMNKGFSGLEIFQDNIVVKTSSYYDVSLWDQYVRYLADQKEKPDLEKEVELDLFYREFANKKNNYNLFLTSTWDGVLTI